MVEKPEPSLNGVLFGAVCLEEDIEILQLAL